MDLTLDCFCGSLLNHLSLAGTFVLPGGKDVVYDSDIFKHNFLYNVATRRICIVDFQYIDVLPKPFQTYGFFNIGSPFATAVGNYLCYRSPDIANAMTPASSVLQ